jgi:hypothetical protein
VTDGVKVTSLSASFLRKISAATDRLRQIALNRKLLTYLLTPWSRVLLEKLTGALNRKLSPKFEESCKVASRFETRSHTKGNRVKRDLPVCNTWCFLPKCYFIRTLQSFFKLQLLKPAGKHINLLSRWVLPTSSSSCLFWGENSKSEHFHSVKTDREETTWKTQAQMGRKF